MHPNFSPDLAATARVRRPRLAGWVRPPSARRLLLVRPCGRAVLRQTPSPSFPASVPWLLCRRLATSPVVAALLVLRAAVLGNGDGRDALRWLFDTMRLCWAGTWNLGSLLSC